MLTKSREREWIDFILQRQRHGQRWMEDGNDEEIKLRSLFAHNKRNQPRLPVLSEGIGGLLLKSVRNYIAVGLNCGIRAHYNIIDGNRNAFKKGNRKLTLTFRHPKWCYNESKTKNVSKDRGSKCNTMSTLPS